MENAQGPPNLLWRVAAAMMYLIPWIDTIHIGREIYHRFPITVIIDRLPGALRGLRSSAAEGHVSYNFVRGLLAVQTFQACLRIILDCAPACAGTPMCCCIRISLGCAVAH